MLIKKGGSSFENILAERDLHAFLKFYWKDKF